jgi:hypothetical protein
VTQQFQAAEQQIYDAGNLVALVVTVDADEPLVDDWHVSYLAPVVAEPAKGIVTQVIWRGRAALTSA